MAYLAASNSAPSAPVAGLTQSGNIFYGTSTGGGNGGTVFALTPPTPIPMNFLSSGRKLILSWTNGAFTLQSSPSLAVTFSNVVNASSPYTNVMTNSQLYFRLQAN